MILMLSPPANDPPLVVDPPKVPLASLMGCDIVTWVIAGGSKPAPNNPPRYT